MEIIVGGRRTGKTTQLIRMAAEAEVKGEKSYIVCEGTQSAYRIAQQAREMGLYIRHPLTYDEFALGHSKGGNIKNFYVDNVDMLVRMFGRDVPIAAITVNKESDAAE